MENILSVKDGKSIKGTLKWVKWGWLMGGDGNCVLLHQMKIELLIFPWQQIEKSLKNLHSIIVFFENYESHFIITIFLINGNYVNVSSNLLIIEKSRTRLKYQGGLRWMGILNRNSSTSSEKWEFQRTFFMQLTQIPTEQKKK